MRAGCQAVLDRLGAPFNADTTVGGLSVAEQQLVEIARALHAESKILVLDEPTTALSTRETDRLFGLVRQLRAEGIALIYISHRMAEIYELADRVAVLRDGGYVGTLTREELNPDILVKMMVGRDLSTFYTKTHDPRGSHGPVVLEVRGITDGGRRVHPCSLQLHRSEVLGIAGLVGSGRTELARLIYGADPKVAGDVLLDDIPVTIRAPEEALEAGIAYLTEDRKALGLFLDFPAGTNINLGVIGRDARIGGILDWTMWRRRASEAFETLRVRAASPQVLVGSLSGGNQQKVLLSRWLEISPKVLILDEPTRGVDIGAKSEIYRIIDELAISRDRNHRHLQRAARDHRRLRPRISDARGPHRRRGRRPCRNSHHTGKHYGLWRRRNRVAAHKRENTMADGKTEPSVSATGAAGVGSGGAGLSARQVQIRSLLQSLGMLPVLIIFAIAFHYLGAERFLTGQNLSIVAQQAAINTVLGAGMTFVILTGGIDLSVGSVLAASAMAALIASLIPGWGMLGVPAALLTGLFFGLINGSLIAFGRLPPFIVTLGSLTAVRGLARLMGGDFDRLQFRPAIRLHRQHGYTDCTRL